MVSEEDGDEAVNDEEVFSMEETIRISLIVQMRIYDTLMALLQDANPDAASNLMDIHATGAIVGFSPSMNGVFVADEMNRAEDSAKSSE